MKKNSLSVWHWYGGWKYYLRHPIRWFRDLFYNLGYIKDRCRKGYCFLDYTNFSEWFCKIVPSMLRDISDKGYAYPGAEPFDTPEKWHDWLHKTADEIEWCSEEYLEEHDVNEYRKAYYDQIDRWLKENPESITGRIKDDPESEERKVFLNWYDREMEIQEEANQKIKHALSEMGEHFMSLWD